MSASIAILLALPAYLAWDYGGVLPWSQWLATVVVLIVAIVSIPLLIQHGNPGRHRLLTIPLICIAVWGLAGLQIAPLNESIVGLLSRGSAAAYTDWIPTSVRGSISASANSDIAVIGEERYRVSVCSHLTRAAQTGPALFAVVCLIASVVFRSRATLVWMLAAIAISGAVIAFLGISDQIRAPAPGIHSSIITPTVQAGAPFGPFVCRNNAAGYLNLTLAAAIGLLVYSFRLAQDQTDGDSKYQLQPETWWDRPLFFLQNSLLQIDTATIAALILVILNIAGILASQSRGGTLAVIAGTIVASLLTGSRSARFWQPLGILLSVGGVAILLGSIGLIERIRDRLESLWSSDAAQDGRLDHWPDGLAAAWQYFPAGSGLGTYRFAYLPYQRTSAGAWFVNADNMAVEWLVEGGVWLLPLVIVAVVILASCLTRLAEVRKAPHLTALIATGWFAIGSQMVSEFFDFGILLPSNYLTLAILVGAVLGASSRRYQAVRRHSFESWKAASRPNFPLLVTFAVAIIPLASAFRFTQQNASDDYLIREIVRSGGQISLDDTAMQQSLRQSNNPFLHTAVAARTIAQQATAGERGLKRLDTAETVNHSQMAGLEARRAAFYLNAVPQQQPAEAILLPGQSIEEIRSAHQHAAIALLLCPLDDVARFQLLQTGFVADDSLPSVNALLAQWGRLRRQYGDALDRAARLAAIYPGGEAAKPLIKQMLIVDPQRLQRIWPVFELIGGEEVIADVLPDDPVLLLRAIETQPMGQQLKQALTTRLRQRLATGPSAQDGAHWAYLGGRLEVTRRNYTKAEEWFEQAVAADPSTTIYRFHLAEMLERNGKRAEALEQIALCVLQDPKNSQYQAKRKSLMSSARSSRAD